MSAPYIFRAGGGIQTEQVAPESRLPQSNVSSASVHKADVCIVGSGVLGLVSALLLARAGSTVCIVSPDFRIQHKKTGSVLNFAPPDFALGAFWPSPNDPSTRTLVAHGHETTVALHDLHQAGVNCFFALQRTFFPHLRAMHSPVFRYALEKFEHIELQKAVEQKLGLVNSFDKKIGSSSKKFNENDVDLFQGQQPYSPVRGVNDAAVLESLFFETDFAGECLVKGAVLDNPVSFLNGLFTALSRYEKSVSLVAGTAVELLETSLGVTLRVDVATENPMEVQSEVSILACGSHIASLLPNYRSILVPMSDMSFAYAKVDGETERKSSVKPLSQLLSAQQKTLEMPRLFRGQSGHVCFVWAGANSSRPLRFSGPKFLLPGAGVGAEKLRLLDAGLQAKALEFHRAKSFLFVARALGFTSVQSFQRYLEDELVVSLQPGCFGTDTLPCDELPVVGEFGKWGRVLGSAGFLGTGLSAQCAVAFAFADFLEKGNSSLLPSALSPRRFHT